MWSTEFHIIIPNIPCFFNCILVFQLCDRIIFSSFTCADNIHLLSEFWYVKTCLTSFSIFKFCFITSSYSSMILYQSMTGTLFSTRPLEFFKYLVFLKECTFFCHSCKNHKRCWIKFLSNLNRNNYWDHEKTSIITELNSP